MLSYQVAEALAPFWPIQHVVGHPDNTAPVHGQCNVPDEVIAPWASEQRLVVVTIDTDFKARWVKTKLLQNHGVEVIVFTTDLKGPRVQHGRITKHLPYWITDLGRYEYGYRIWDHTENNRPSWRGGSKKRATTG